MSDQERFVLIRIIDDSNEEDILVELSDSEKGRMTSFYLPREMDTLQLYMKAYCNTHGILRVVDLAAGGEQWMRESTADEWVKE